MLSFFFLHDIWLIHLQTYYVTNRYFGDIIVLCFVLPEFVSEVITVSFGGGGEVFTGFFLSIEAIRAQITT